jgi:hypothetical protein
VNPKHLAPKIPGAAKTQKKLYLSDDLRQGLRNCPKLVIIFSINIIILQDEFSPQTLQESLSPSRILGKSYFSESQNTPPPQPTNTQSMSLNYLSPLTIIIISSSSRKLTTSTRVLKKALLWHFM